MRDSSFGKIHNGTPVTQGFVHARRVQTWDIFVKHGPRNAFVRAFLRSSKHKLLKRKRAFAVTRVFHAHAHKYRGGMNLFREWFLGRAQ